MAKNTKPKSNSKEGNYDSKFTGTRRNKGSNRGKGSSRRSECRGKEIKEEMKSTNDPSWYSASPELLRDAASIPFSWPTGTRLDTGAAINNDTVPGVCALRVRPTIGSQMNMNSPVNVASNAIYSFVRHANSGHSNYDAPDLMLYLLAMSNIYSYVTWCQRLLGIVNMYDQRNRYMPYALCSANRVNFEDLKNNIANFRYWLNNFITKVASLAVPATMNVFSRLAFLYSNVYIDGPTIKDQLYMYVPVIPSQGSAWMKFALDAGGAGSLIWAPFVIAGGGNYAAVSDIIAYGNDLFNAIWDQEDFGIMSGDILKAYGDNIIKLATVPEDFQILPTYDSMVLHQMKNAKLVGQLDISPITQTNGVISQLVMVDSGATDEKKRMQREYLLFNKVLSSDFEQPGPEVVIESTRLMVGYDALTNYIHTGTEVAIELNAWLFRNDGTLTYYVITWDTFNQDSATSVSTSLYKDRCGRLGALKAFKYAPELFAGLTMANGSYSSTDAQRIWDVDNYAVLSASDIIKMHEAATMSLFAVPAIAKIS